MGAASTTTGRAGTARRPGARQARRSGVRVQKPAVEPPQVERRLEPGGSGPVSSARPAARRATSGRSRVGRPGGHGEGLRRSRGEAAGEELGTNPVERSVVNVGTTPASPRRAGPPGRKRAGPSSSHDDGVGRSLVVVRGRESRPHGQGRQQDRSRRTGRPGGRR